MVRSITTLLAAVSLAGAAILLPGAAVPATIGAGPATVQAASDLTLGPTTTQAASDLAPAPVTVRAARDLAPGPAAGRQRAHWQWPLAPRPSLTRAFEPPSERWSAGHRGVDLTPVGSRTVTAVDAGTITHVGVIAGKPTLSITHASGIRSTYEPVTSPLPKGARVARGDVIGTLSDARSHCTPTCLHLGAIRSTTYLNPLALLGLAPVVLLPLDG